MSWLIPHPLYTRWWLVRHHSVVRHYSVYGQRALWYTGVCAPVEEDIGKRRNGALTITKINEVYSKAHWEFRYIWDWIPRGVRDHGEELHARHTWVIVEDR
jgi:hypothetical protein